MFKHRSSFLEEDNDQEFKPGQSSPYHFSSPRHCKNTLGCHGGKKRSWTSEEDAYLIKLVHKYGAQKWTSIADNLPGTYKVDLGRIGKQCRERWHNHLNPAIKKDEWSEE